MYKRELEGTPSLGEGRKRWRRILEGAGSSSLLSAKVTDVVELIRGNRGKKGVRTSAPRIPDPLICHP